jgi:hypothetical protein
MARPPSANPAPVDARTLAFAIAGLVALSAFAGWRGMRPPNPYKGPRMIPWRWIMLLSATVALLMLVQLATMLNPSAAGTRLS